MEGAMEEVGIENVEPSLSPPVQPDISRKVLESLSGIPAVRRFQRNCVAPVRLNKSLNLKVSLHKC